LLPLKALLRPGGFCNGASSGFKTPSSRFKKRDFASIRKVIQGAQKAQWLRCRPPVKEFIKSHAMSPAGQSADALIRQSFNWSGKPSVEALDDDITLMVADYQHA
jgi:hypothetical protein